ncbi:hypothetical protein [Salibaculum griseiflavum]|jgi:hypothetical protein|uniref:Uncharacterized protein n=1 Tax=Salibaculum griseiflavum TaxID=1914409 RepID=A0A2V1P445_9RHOB|nr:hypothetical protein [Salibaculum griseiflavum]PWG17281.1 hypothetical protein DFK10_07805 [Salibaculum griseiflavum]
MKPNFVVTALAALGLSATMAMADSPVRYASASGGQVVVTGGLEWLVAANGCSYSKVLASGGETRWQIVVNGERLGLTNARPGCPATIVTGS